MSVSLAYVSGKSDVKATGWKPHPAKVGGMLGGDVAAGGGERGRGRAKERLRGGGRVISRVVKSTRVKNNSATAVPFTA